MKGGRECGTKERKGGTGRRIHRASRHRKLGVTRRRFPVLGRVLVRFGGHTPSFQSANTGQNRQMLELQFKASQALPVHFRGIVPAQSLRRSAVHFRVVASLLIRCILALLTNYKNIFRIIAAMTSNVPSFFLPPKLHKEASSVTYMLTRPRTAFGDAERARVRPRERRETV